jgi:hypothetical protein
MSAPYDGSAEPLAGGFINQVVRIGDTVRRSGASQTGFIVPLLQFFESQGWSGAPRFLGIDEQDRQVLSFIEGLVPIEPEIPRPFMTDEALAAVARMVREFHDLTAGTDLAGTEEVVCHNDLSPKNTVYREDNGVMTPVAFIDWDLAAPNRRILDVAQVCWKFLSLGPSVPDSIVCSHQLRLVCDAYGLADRHELIDRILWWQEAAIWGIERGVETGDPSMIRLKEAGLPTEIRSSIAWVTQTRSVLEQAL